MDRLDFFRAVLSDTGYYCLFAAKKDRRKTKFYVTLEQLSYDADQFDAYGYDVYFALATFKTGENRKAENAKQLKSLFLDLDCGKDKHYQNQIDAINDLKRFTVSLGLPKPILVNSGGGVHVYWPLVEPVDVTEWLPVAEALKRACAAMGLHADAVATADAARVLRVPGSRNFKRDIPTQVEILSDGGYQLTLADISQKLVEYKTKNNTADIGHGLSVADDPVMQRLISNRSFSIHKILEKTARGRGCAQLNFAVTEQDKVSEPLWRAALSIAKFCVEGRSAAHRISRGHPEYDITKTNVKFDGIKAPYTCATIDSIRPGVCNECPNWNKIKSPILLGAMIEEDTNNVTHHDIENEGDEDITEVKQHDIENEGDEDITEVKQNVATYHINGNNIIPSLPFPYFRGKNGGIYIRQKNEDGDADEICIYINDLYYTRRVVDPEYGECIIGRLNLPNDGTREFVVPLVASTSKEELRKCLAKYGVSVIPKRWDALMAYTNAWVEKLQQTTTADTAKTQFGWSDNSFRSYVLGEREIFANEIGYNPPSSKTSMFFSALKPKGTLEGWIKQAEFYNRSGLEPYQYVICHALAAPLMRFTPIHAAIFDFYSDGTGHGKSTTQKFALTIYGDPDRLIVGPKDTLNARMNRLEVMKDVNVQFDEFTEFPAEDVSELIYGLTDGRQKARLRSSSNDERYRGEPWHTTVCASSNHSMLAKVYSIKSNPRAEVQRVLRYHVQPYNFTDKLETDIFAREVGMHTGHAIVPFVQKIMSDPATAKQLVETIQRRIDIACGLTMQNRFWSVQGAVTMAALVLARDLGLLFYDTTKLFNWTVQLINDNKINDRESIISIEALINDFVNENYGNILWIKSTDDARTSNNSGLDKLVLPEMQPKITLAARYETDTKKLYIPFSTLKTWCGKRRLNFDSVLLELKEKMGAYKKNMRLSKGTKLVLPPTLAIVINFSAVGLEASDGSGEEE